MLAPFDEMDGWTGGPPRDAYAQVRAWLAETPCEILQTRRAQAELLFRRTGITFSVYGDPGGLERIIPFDLVPRLITAQEWARIERGLVQRVEALNAPISPATWRWPTPSARAWPTTRPCTATCRS
jgi:uncharacterized circularly permuted ATP-grasp superfamily protein